ncbi:MAG: protein-L-isoaspartate(D-aspartate) O-methyltransferase [bacterium]|nr:protein-L-isoaspartate(D-aspartate) O-methyltransferase [bacterium]
MSAPGEVDSERYAAARAEMVRRQIEARGVRNAGVLAAMRDVPRHAFVPPTARRQAHVDGPLAIGHGQTISQPYIVALMTELLNPTAAMRVLEIGTGSGYQTAVLSRCVARVYSVEIVPGLARDAARRLERLGCDNVETREVDGTDGWPEAAPFDGILVTAAPQRIPPALVEQLADGGRLVIPVGSIGQELIVVTRTADGSESRSVTPVRFVPMTGDAERL